MSSYRYIFRARNPEQGVKFISVEHDQADDIDGAFRKVVERFRMRDREFVQHFATQKVINADTIDVKFADADALKAWTPSYDPTPRPEHYIPPAVKIATGEWLDANVAAAGKPVGFGEMIFHADGTVTGFNLKDCIWVRAVDLQPNDIIIWNGEARLIDQVHFNDSTKPDVPAIFAIAKGKQYAFHFTAQPVLVRRIGNSTSKPYDVIEVAAKNAGEHEWAIIGSNLHQRAVEILFADISGSSHVRVRYRTSGDKKFYETYENEHKLKVLTL